MMLQMLSNYLSADTLVIQPGHHILSVAIRYVIPILCNSPNATVRGGQNSHQEPICVSFDTALNARFLVLYRIIMPELDPNARRASVLS